MFLILSTCNHNNNHNNKLYPSGGGNIQSMGEGGFGGIFHVGLSPSHFFFQAQIRGIVRAVWPAQSPFGEGKCEGYIMQTFLPSSGIHLGLYVVL